MQAARDATVTETAAKIAQHDFRPLRSAMDALVDDGVLSGISCAIFSGREPVEVYCAGWADREAGVPLALDHIFRVYSNTKLVTSAAVLLLLEQGCFTLDDPIAHFIPELGDRRVLLAGATSIDQTEPAARTITIRHLLTHTSGLSYGLSDDGRLISQAYIRHRVLNPDATLAEMMDVLAGLPLVFHPGTSWEYSVATDVLARLVEIVSGERFDSFLKRCIFEPLGIADTGFEAPAPERLAAFYGAPDPAKQGLVRMEAPYAVRTGRPNRWLNGGGGLFSTLPDMVALIRGLLLGGPTLLKPETILMMGANQLPEGVTIGVPGRGHGLAAAVVVEPGSDEPAESRSELYWGGMAGTQWWISPGSNSAGVIMTQLHLSFDMPFVAQLKRLAYTALKGR